jgi:O-antigen/teichoic acid export membrane protein
MQYSEKTPPDQATEIIPTKHAFRSGIYIIIGKLFTIIASFAAVTVLANAVPKEVAGTYNYVMAAFTIISITTLPGMNNALARAVAKGYDGNVDRSLRKRFIFGSIGIAISIVIGIIELCIGHTQLGIAFLIIAPFVPLTDTMSNFTTSFWQGKKDFKKSALYNALYYIGFGILNIFVFLLTNNIYIILLGVLTGQTIVGYLVFRSIKRENNTYDHESLKLGYHLTIMQGFRIFAGNIDRVIVWYLAGPAMVASYTFAATPVFKAYQLIPVGAVTLPHLSNHELTSHTKRIVIKKTLSLF